MFRGTHVTCPGSFRKLTKGNNSKDIDARVMDLVHDYCPFSALFIYEVLFKKHQLKFYCKNEKYDGGKKTTGNNSKNTDARLLPSLSSIHYGSISIGGLDLQLLGLVGTIP